VNPRTAKAWACRLTQALARSIARGVQPGATAKEASGTSSSHSITRLKPMTSSTVTVVEYFSLWISSRPARYEAPGSVSSAPTTNVVRADPLLSSRCQRGGPFVGPCRLARPPTLSEALVAPGVEDERDGERDRSQSDVDRWTEGVLGGVGRA
jgi:hypothetical protein